MPTYSFIRESVEDRHHERGGARRVSSRALFADRNSLTSEHSPNISAAIIR